ncbi:hypothetical protein [Coralloluteibacterium thermophilus]|uniref:Uncharacterized protein n=1 Tax=Coralloluteibacterium thermophilum TaxID=2707049 RepID=A0ABV9NMT5_9GAMM
MKDHDQDVGQGTASTSQRRIRILNSHGSEERKVMTRQHSADKAPKYKPRFDFDENNSWNAPQTATINELLDELNYEETRTSQGSMAANSQSNGKLITMQALESTLSFIREAVGEELNGTTRHHPIKTIKTIKLLYAKKDDSGSHLFRRLARPKDDSATMEHWTARSTTRNEYTIKLADELMQTLSLELEPERLRRIETSLLTTSKLLECIEHETFEILEPIYYRLSGNDEALAAAFKLMELAASSYVPDASPLQYTAPPLHERIYIYLRTLPFYHFIGEYKRIVKAQEDVVSHVQSVREQMGEFCKHLSKEIGTDVDADTPITSIMEFPEFLARHSLPLGKLVQLATGIKNNQRDLTGITGETKKLLHAYVFHQWHKTSADVTNLSAADCVAALCTIRHQQKVKTPYTPSWIGQESAEKTISRLLTHLGRDRSINELYEDDYIPQGAMQILYHRFCLFHARMSDRYARQQAWIDFQLERLEKYAECFNHSDIDCIDRSVSGFNLFCCEKALEACTLIRA